MKKKVVISDNALQTLDTSEAPPPEEHSPLRLMSVDETALLATIGQVIHNLKTSEASRITRKDLGFKVSAFYNWPFCMRVDIVRLDKRDFFEST
jgi:hypothetical protein